MADVVAAFACSPPRRSGAGGGAVPRRAAARALPDGPVEARRPGRGAAGRDAPEPPTGVHPPGRYDVVVVGNGPRRAPDLLLPGPLRGLARAYLGRRRARWDVPPLPGLRAADQRTKPDAPFEPGTREYEAYDHNSLLADDPAYRALVPRYMTAPSTSPAPRDGGRAGGICRPGGRRGSLWLPLGIHPARGRRPGATTSDGEYRCSAAVFAVGVTQPWKGGIPGADLAPHYVETKEAAAYRGKRLVIIGKRNSAFELANGLLALGTRAHSGVIARSASDVGAPAPRPVPSSPTRSTCAAARRRRRRRGNRPHRARAAAATSSRPREPRGPATSTLRPRR